MKSSPKKLRLQIIALAVVVIIAAGVAWYTFYSTNADSQTAASYDTSETTTANTTRQGYSNTEEGFLSDIKTKYLSDWQEITVDEWTEKYGGKLYKPDYLPAAYTYYDGIFIEENTYTGETETLQLWYDPVDFDLLTIEQRATDEPDGILAGESGLQNLSGDFIYDLYPWATHYVLYSFNQDGTYVFGYMLINDNSLLAECTEILESISAE